jgi:hypothetical protein
LRSGLHSRNTNLRNLCNLWVVHVFAVCFFLVIFSYASTSFAQTEQQVRDSFEKRVPVFENLFSSNPKYLKKGEFKDSPTGYIFHYEIYSGARIAHGVIKTDTSVSDYMGYVTVAGCRVASSTRCGEVKVKYGQRYFSNLESARRNRDNKACYDGEKASDHDFAFIFDFKNGHWIFRFVQENNKPTFFWPVHSELDDNVSWKKLIE